MLEQLTEWTGQLSGLLWGSWITLAVLLGVGLYLTIKLHFVQVRGFRHSLTVIRGKYSCKDDPGEVTHFQALSTALSATVGTGNIAGVKIPVFTSLTFVERTPDFFTSRAWIDDAIKVVRELIKLRIERKVLREQQRCIEEELRTTNQRVNLFEKVKIPESKEHIRVIRIFLGDEQTSGVVRSKIAKRKTLAREDAQ